jgi:signal transduction histidine kinase
VTRSRRPGGTLSVLMSSTVGVSRLFAARLGSRILVDAAIVVVVLAGSLSQIEHGGIAPTRSESGGLDLAGVVLAGCAAVPLIAWRRSPLGVFVVTAVAGVLLAGLGYPIDLILGPTAALYLLAASRERETPWTGRTTAIAVGLLMAYLAATAVAQGTFPGIELLHTGLAWSVAWFAGERTRLRREHVADLSGRAVRAERDAERERLLAIAEERTRIARDLHDSAGHAISLIAVRAGAARLRHHEDPGRSLLALRAVEELARKTVDDIDQIVNTLRESTSANDAVEAPPGLASIDTLIAHHAAAGLRIRLETTGMPRTLGGAADQAAYRILQEALTNAARHGAGSATIALVFGDQAVELIVTNPPVTDGSSRSGGGHGLIGMRERATLLGGSLDAGVVDGAFRVHARIPSGGQHS